MYWIKNFFKTYDSYLVGLIYPTFPNYTTSRPSQLPEELFCLSRTARKWSPKVAFSLQAIKRVCSSFQTPFLTCRCAAYYYCQHYYYPSPTLTRNKREKAKKKPGKKNLLKSYEQAMLAKPLLLAVPKQKRLLVGKCNLMTINFLCFHKNFTQAK